MFVAHIHETVLGIFTTIQLAEKACKETWPDCQWHEIKKRKLWVAFRGESAARLCAVEYTDVDPTNFN